MRLIGKAGAEVLQWVLVWLKEVLWYIGCFDDLYCEYRIAVVDAGALQAR